MATRSLGSLTLDLIARIGGFEQGMDKAARVSEKRLKEIQKRAEEVGKKIGIAMGSIAAAATGAGTAALVMLKSTAAATTESDRWAKSLGMSTSTLQQWQYAAERAGLSADNMADIFKDIGDKIGDALVTGGGEAIDAIDKLGLSLDDLANMTPDKQLLAIADGLKQVGSQSEKINILESLGNDLSRMLPLLNNGAEGLRKYMQQAKDFGIALEPSQIASLVKANEVIEDLQAQVRGLRNEFVAGLADIDLSPLQHSLDGVRDIVNDPSFQQGIADLAAMVVKLTGAAALGLSQLPDDLKKMSSDLKYVLSWFSTDEKSRHLAGVKDEETTNRALGSYNKAQGGWNKFAANPTMFVGELFGQDLSAAKKASDDRLASYKAYTDLRGWADDKLVEGNKKLLEGDKALAEQEGKLTISRKGANGVTDKLLDSYDKLAKLEKDRASLVAAQAKDPENAERYRRAIEAIDKQVAQLNGTTKSAAEAQNKLKQQLKEASATYKELKQSFDPVSFAADEFRKRGTQLDLLLKNGKITQDEYNKGIAEMAKQFNIAVATTDPLVLRMKEIASYQAALDTQLGNLKRSGQRAAEAVGMGSSRAALQDQLNGVDDTYAEDRKALAAQYADAGSGMSAEEYNRKLDALKKNHQQMADQVKANYAEMKEAQGDWTNGARGAWEDYLDSAQDIAGQTRSLFSNAFSSMEDAITQFAMTGKLSFADFTKSVLADMARIAARQAASSALSSLFGMAASAASSYFGGATGATQAGYTGSGFSSWVAGQRATGGPVAPNSLYEVNERGPELYNQGGRSYLMTGANGGSVTPLTSGASPGAPGAASSGGSYIFPITINVDASGAGGGAGASQEEVVAAGKNIQNAARVEAETAVRKGLAPGGSIYNAIRGRG
ncbi:phage tail tape measure protein [Pseudomonas sp. W17]|uniref:Phage tail tape measure protein n=2 Tax=unclassified Pseudomonas TaxID=196821 RepID=A0AAU7WNS8_9PSED